MFKRCEAHAEFSRAPSPHHLDEVLAVVEAQLRDTLNVTLDFQFVPSAEYRSKILMMMAAGDDFDLHLNAQWLSIYTMIADGSIQAWDELPGAYRLACAGRRA